MACHSSFMVGLDPKDYDERRLFCGCSSEKEGGERDSGRRRKSAIVLDFYGSKTGQPGEKTEDTRKKGEGKGRKKKQAEQSALLPTLVFPVGCFLHPIAGNPSLFPPLLSHYFLFCSPFRGKAANVCETFLCDRKLRTASPAAAASGSGKTHWALFLVCGYW